ncbi:class I SAM-dependent methyltransferase [Ornithinimicrobium sp. F0845]|uniref:methyltransferase n=1 Tax=Ornithinimicrobium sp. F0845 TaxID=2926412 RepID=UPI001FF6AF1C|nr:class I SAM-dependent methyltransferase [Ornithinimicrobium sp. F0845]MCK0110568.1 class I SAM-dependent methyltransferase [Ornithinimicrobium sp. F0845]
MTPTVDFSGLQITYDERVLEPRRWTADQSRWAAELMSLAPPGPVLELCCGAGHIGLLATALTAADTRRHLVAVDLNPAAVTLSTANAAAAGLDDWVEVRGGDMSEVLSDREVFSVIIADPPWVATEQTTRYPEDPLLAIDGGPDGLAVARLCARVMQEHLHRDGVAVLQLGDLDQVDALDLTAYCLEVTEVRAGERGVLASLRRLGPDARPA